MLNTSTEKRINIHKRNHTKHSTNNTKHSKYQYTNYQTPTQLSKHPHTHTHTPTFNVHTVRIKLHYILLWAGIAQSV